MVELVDAMTDENPAERPTIEEVHLEVLLHPRLPKYIQDALPHHI